MNPLAVVTTLKRLLRDDDDAANIEGGATLEIKIPPPPRLSPTFVDLVSPPEQDLASSEARQAPLAPAVGTSTSKEQQRTVVEPNRRNKRILAVGSGNCSYEVSLVLHALPIEEHVLDVTVYEPTRDDFVAKYAEEEGELNLLALEACGQRVLFNVDATNLLETLRKAGQSQRGQLQELPPGDKSSLLEKTPMAAVTTTTVQLHKTVMRQGCFRDVFGNVNVTTHPAVETQTLKCPRFQTYDVIYWHNPYPFFKKDGLGTDARNHWLQTTLPKFFDGCRRLLAENGRVCVTMTTEQQRSINLQGLAHTQKLAYVDTLAFRKEQVPHYLESFGDERVLRVGNHQRADYVHKYGTTQTYVFRVQSDPQPGLPEQEPSAKRRKLVGEVQVVNKEQEAQSSPLTKNAAPTSTKSPAPAPCAVPPSSNVPSAKTKSAAPILGEVPDKANAPPSNSAGKSSAPTPVPGKSSAPPSGSSAKSAAPPAGIGKSTAPNPHLHPPAPGIIMKSSAPARAPAPGCSKFSAPSPGLLGKSSAPNPGTTTGKLSAPATVPGKATAPAPGVAEVALLVGSGGAAASSSCPLRPLTLTAGGVLVATAAPNAAAGTQAERAPNAETKAVALVSVNKDKAPVHSPLQPLDAAAAVINFPAAGAMAKSRAPPPPAPKTPAEAPTVAAKSAKVKAPPSRPARPVTEEELIERMLERQRAQEAADKVARQDKDRAERAAAVIEPAGTATATAQAEARTRKIDSEQLVTTKGDCGADKGAGQAAVSLWSIDESKRARPRNGILKRARPRKGFGPHDDWADWIVFGNVVNNPDGLSYRHLRRLLTQFFLNRLRAGAARGKLLVNGSEQRTPAASAVIKKLLSGSGGGSDPGVPACGGSAAGGAKAKTAEGDISGTTAAKAHNVNTMAISDAEKQFMFNICKVFLHGYCQNFLSTEKLNSPRELAATPASVLTDYVRLILFNFHETKKVCLTSLKRRRRDEQHPARVEAAEQPAPGEAGDPNKQEAPAPASGASTSSDVEAPVAEELVGVETAAVVGLLDGQYCEKKGVTSAESKQKWDWLTDSEGDWLCPAKNFSFRVVEATDVLWNDAWDSLGSGVKVARHGAKNGQGVWFARPDGPHVFRYYHNARPNILELDLDLE